MRYEKGRKLTQTSQWQREEKRHERVRQWHSIQLVIKLELHLEPKLKKRMLLWMLN